MLDVPVNILKVKPILTPEQVEALESNPATNDLYTTVIRESTDLVDETTGRVIVHFRKGIIPPKATRVAKEIFGNIDKKIKPSTTRNAAAGVVDLKKIKKVVPKAIEVLPLPGRPCACKVRIEGGHVLTETYCNPVYSYVAGYNFHRYGGRVGMTPISRRYGKDWERAEKRFFFYIGRALRKVNSKGERHMRKWAERNGVVQSGLTISKTALSTVDINVNYNPYLHFDRNGLPNGWSTLTVIEEGKYKGGYFVYPAYGVAIDVRQGDLVVNQPHMDLHGNTAIVPLTKGAKRISFVTYLEKMLGKGKLRYKAEDPELMTPEKWREENGVTFEGDGFPSTKRKKTSKAKNRI